MTDTVDRRHLEIYEALRLDLKIAADGFHELSQASPFEICRRIQGKSGKRGVYEVYAAACAVYCHELYFRHILPEGGQQSLPHGKCAELLRRSFGSVGNFFYLVRTLAAGTASPGFLWLYARKSRRESTLGLTRLPLYTLPDLTRIRPLMCIDLWEHAYIDRYGRDISGFADDTLRHLDWDGIFADLT